MKCHFVLCCVSLPALQKKKVPLGHAASAVKGPGTGSQPTPPPRRGDPPNPGTSILTQDM